MIFDSEYKELISYPEERCRFCELVRSTETGEKLCISSDKNSFDKCRKTGSIVVYSCHAGLTEAVAPLRNDNTIIGYIMFGQILDKSERSPEKTFDYITDSEILNEIKLAASKVKVKNKAQILAAAKILEACTYYVLYNDLISYKKDKQLSKILDYIDANLNEDIKISDLCSEFNISRSRLYDLTKEYFNGGIAKFIKLRKIEHSKLLLKETDNSIRDISETVGFKDYNYFCRAFKKQTGLSPNKYRKNQ